MKNSKVLGSTLIIAGTSIGAGMLALPLASAGLGCFTSFIILLVMWLLMSYTALLMLEVHQHAAKDATLHTLASQFLGRRGDMVATVSMLFLFYALCAAYIAGGGAQFNVKLTDWFHLAVPQEVGTILFTVIVATVVTFGTGSVDMVNRLLFSAKIVVLAIMLFFLTPSINPANLVTMPIHQGLILSALPVIFTSFGFHGSIPAVVRYLDLDMKALRRVLIIGSALPLLIYILWLLTTLGVLSQGVLLQNQNLAAFVKTLSGSIESSQIGRAVSIFADLALVTSFLGVSLGLFEFLGDSLGKGRGGLFIALITFLPPLGFALFYPQGFITALGYAAIALAVLAVLLPVAMVKVARKRYTGSGFYRAPGGGGALVLTGLLGLVIIVSQVLISFGIVPAIG
ncbi:aromatic amino acid transport family protein [Desulfotalea psychrophila]|uniref:Probable tyrosine-specific transport protein n=1 Tax=Desulfotalea psychrophila (strain LSv54 / DSM 12343) TaxID=177439 RepID=Q6APN9_DESPS|nr:aromatic amino acid transport family protein [Desulfotalea psychrophila]CAG35685.1 probable tyrosine-specific transport protein [Desulfotalea psychrophila LSv54]